jgi:hypothetical protein
MNTFGTRLLNYDGEPDTVPKGKKDTEDVKELTLRDDEVEDDNNVNGVVFHAVNIEDPLSLRLGED